MPRNMSFFMTQEQAWAQTKPVTRRNGWGFLKVGDIVQQVVKGQGLKRGEKVQKIHLIKIVDSRWERLDRMTSDLAYGERECVLEGFPELSPSEFVSMYCKANKCTPQTEVHRIEFVYLDPVTGCPVDKR